MTIKCQEIGSVLPDSVLRSLESGCDHSVESSQWGCRRETRESRTDSPVPGVHGTSVPVYYNTSKDVDSLHSIIHRLVVIDIYRLLHLTKAKYMLNSSTHGSFLR